MLNGTVVLLDADGNFVASQRDVTFTENTAEIDMSSKDARAKRVAPGRYSSDVTLDALYVHGDTAFLALRSAMRDGELITIIRDEEGSTRTQTAEALVTSISERFPDQGESTISVSLTIDGVWT